MTKLGLNASRRTKGPLRDAPSEALPARSDPAHVPQGVLPQTESARRRELEALFDLHGDAVYRCAVFLGGASGAETVTNQVFADVWNRIGDIDHTDPAHRGRLVAACVRQFAHAASAVSQRSVLGFVLFSQCSYQDAARLLGDSDANVVRRLTEALTSVRWEMTSLRDGAP